MPQVSAINKPQAEPQSESREDRIRINAYLRWMALTGGNPVSEEETTKIWLETEQRIDSEEEES